MAAKVKDYVTQHEIAARFQIAPHRVRNWAARGQLPEPAFRIPAKVGRPLWEWTEALKRCIGELLGDED